jgi:poly(3-hydroxybutyrate) depolymerase
MRWLAQIVAVVAFASLASPAFAQAPSELDEYVQAQKQGIQAVKASKYDDALAAFRRGLEVLPEDSTSAYNLGCVHSLKGELDPAFEWLAKSVDWGFAEVVDGQLQLLETKDTDLENVRKDARFAALVERAKARRKLSADFAATPETYVPVALKDAASVPLLVVLHDAGQTRSTALEKGPWKRLADELGFALLLPSARCMAGSEPASSMRWFENVLEYGDMPWVYEKTVSDAVGAFRKVRKIDPARMFIVGEGQGGLVAFNVAITSPGSYKGVVVLGSTILGGSSTVAKGRTAAMAGLKAKLLAPDGPMYTLAGAGMRADDDLAAIEKLLLQWQMAGGIERFARKSDDPDQVFNLVKSALQGFLAPPPPPPAPPPDEQDDSGV